MTPASRRGVAAGRAPRARRLSPAAPSTRPIANSASTVQPTKLPYSGQTQAWPRKYQELTVWRVIM